MKTFKPLMGTCVLGLCALAFSVQAQTSGADGANAGAGATTTNGASSSMGAANSTGASNSTGAGMSDTNANTGAASNGSSGTGSSMPMNDAQSQTRYDDDMKKCEQMSGDAKATCETQAQANRDGVTANTNGTQTTPSSNP